MTRALTGAVLIGIALLLSASGRTPAAAAEPAPPVRVAQGSGVRHDVRVSQLPQPAAGPSVVPMAIFPRGFVPPIMQSYLDLQGDGTGETIGIVVAYHHPALVADLNEFSALFGLPFVCATEYADPFDCTTVDIVGPPGLPVHPGWAIETALDVQWAHAIAPRARLLIVEAPDDSLRSMMIAVGQARAAGATVISGSWGDRDSSRNRRYEPYCENSAALCVFATGDSGYQPAYPASSPNVLAVGGTSLKLDNAGGVIFEVGWKDSGGGISRWTRRVPYQTGFSGVRGRRMPDVSYHADPVRGFVVYNSVPYNDAVGWVAVGGTSAGAPQWAAIIAVANAQRVAAGKARLTGIDFAAHRAIYSLAGTSAIFDVTSGSNGTCRALCRAGPGYDLVTGIGSPRPGIDTALAALP